MKKSRKIVGINILILLAVTVFLRFDAHKHSSMGFEVLLIAFWIAFQFVLNIVIGLVYTFRQKKEIGKNFILSAFLVLLIGFSACMGSEQLF